eukprot:1659897-Amphidinium_carterae.1
MIQNLIRVARKTECNQTVLTWSRPLRQAGQVGASSHIIGSSGTRKHTTQRLYTARSSSNLLAKLGLKDIGPVVRLMNNLVRL